MKGFWVLPICICFSSCMVSNGLEYESLSETNLYHIARIRKGMSEKQVLQIMHKPYSYETFEVEDDIYDVWFYVTRATGLDQTRMVPQNLTPLTFKNGILVGTGYYWYYYAMKEQAGEIAAQKPEVEKPKTQEAEDADFEKALRTPPQKGSPPPNGIQKTPEKEKLPPNVRIVQNEGLSNRFSFLSRGMSETEVINILGEPMKYETFQIGYDVFDVWFYDTIASKSGKTSIIPQNMTPLIFKNAVLISMSDEEFFRLKEQATAAPTPPIAVEPRIEPIQEKKASIFKPYVSKTPLGVTKKDFSKVKKGMTEEEVMHLIGPTAEQESISVNSDVYEIWFYDVGSKKNQRKVPLTFKSGVLVGMTQADYDKVKAQADSDQIRGYDRTGERMEEDESEQNFNYW